MNSLRKSIGNANNTGFLFVNLSGYRGKIRYEMSNHLGNVLTVISDKRILVCNADTVTYSYASIISATDYSPFGAPLAGRTFSSESYRFRFNGQEQDNEIAGTGNIMTAEFWMYDGRLGRRWNLDPIEYPWQSGYVTFNNNPNYFNDPFGLEGEKPGDTRETSDGCTERFTPGKNGESGSWQDVPEAVISGERITSQNFQREARSFLGELDDAVHNPNSRVSNVGQSIGKFITEFHPGVSIYNIGSRNGWWGNGNNIWDEKSNVLEAGMDYIAFIPDGGSTKRISRLIGKYKKMVDFNVAAFDVINNGIHFKYLDKIHVALKVSDEGEIMLGPAMSADAACSNIDDAIYSVSVILQDPKVRMKVINTAKGFLNDMNLVNYPDRIKEIEEIINVLEAWN